MWAPLFFLSSVSYHVSNESKAVREASFVRLPRVVLHKAELACAASRAMLAESEHQPESTTGTFAKYLQRVLSSLKTQITSAFNSVKIILLQHKKNIIYQVTKNVMYCKEKTKVFLFNITNLHKFYEKMKHIFCVQLYFWEDKNDLSLNKNTNLTLLPGMYITHHLLCQYFRLKY